VKDETAQSEDMVSQTPEQKAEHERRVKTAEQRNKAKTSGQPESAPSPATTLPGAKKR
jgi:hypothetical protein